MVAKFTLSDYRSALAGLHDHICPRQILGLRMGIYGAALLKVPVPQREKRLIAFVETNGCYADGVAVATGCTLGHRTMYLEDYGKAAVTLADSYTGNAVRVTAHPESRNRAKCLVLDAETPWQAYFQAYQILDDEELLVARPVVLQIDLEKLISKAGHRTVCTMCGEEIMNERECQRDGMTLCQACAGNAYYMTEAMTAPACHDFPVRGSDS